MIDKPSTSIPQQGRQAACAGYDRLDRSPLLPRVRSVSESGFPGYEAGVYICLRGPAGIPPEIVTRLSGEVIREAGIKLE